MKPNSWLENHDRRTSGPTIAPAPLRAHEEDVPRAAVGVGFALGLLVGLGLAVIVGVLL